MKILNSLDRFIARIEGGALIIILLAMMFVAFAQIVLRNLLHTALPWGDGLTRALVLWAGFIGASLAVSHGRYLSIDVLSRHLGSRWQRRTRLLVYAYAATVSLLLSLGGVMFVRCELEAATMTSLGLRSGAVAAIIPLTFVVLAFRFALKLVNLLAGGELEKQQWEQ